MTRHTAPMRALALCAALALWLTGCGWHAPAASGGKAVPPSQSAAIYLYGERHGDPAILDMELELWQTYYHQQGMRHLFVELGYFTGAYLNLWMEAGDDAILYQLYEDWQGTQAYTQAYLGFFKAIKETCPETVFHATDVGHQYQSTGARYLGYLAENGLADSPEYLLAEQAVEQGRAYYASGSEQAAIYRENTLVENFIREYDALDGAAVMGIYGADHTQLGRRSGSTPCDTMGTQLKAKYGDLVAMEDLNARALAAARPQRTETLDIGGKTYAAEYFGKQDLSAVFPEYRCREFWRLKDAYEDLSQGQFTGNHLPQSNYPMLIEPGQAYAVRYTAIDSGVRMEYHICDGTLLASGEHTTREVSPG